MTIEGDVRVVAHYFGLDPALLQAVVNAEGNIVRAVQCTFPDVTDRREALQVTARSAVHALCDYVKRGGHPSQEAFVDMWAQRWAPVGAKNDPKSLNVNWPKNVLNGWLASGA